MADLLLELGLEEVPDRFLPALRAGLKQQLLAALQNGGLKIDPATAVAYGGPRRLAVFVPDLPERLPDEMKKGPPVQQAFGADGKPTPAAEGFAKKLGLSVDDLKKSEDGKFLMGFQKGAALTDTLPQLITLAVGKMELPKTMRWGDGAHEFVRPLRWLVALFGESVIPLNLFGIAAGRNSQGARKPDGNPLALDRPAAYLATLEAAGIQANFIARKAVIHAKLTAAAQAVGGVLQEDEELLERVTDLVETPGVVSGAYDPAFLAMPPEILVTAMREHQKNFAVRDAFGTLLPRFLAVIDKAGDKTGAIVRGNEAVLKSRLADARFFYEEDLKTGLDALREKTLEINFYTGLGNLHDKSERLGKLAAVVNPLGINAQALATAAKYAKADLASNLIGEKEFNGLQGLAGSFYLNTRHFANSFEKQNAAAAIANQYRVSDSESPTAHQLGLADRLDTLAGFFMIGKMPTGSKDPFALRRAGNQFWQLYFKISQPPAVKDLINAAGQIHLDAGVKPATPDWQESLRKFFLDRLDNYYLELGFTRPEILSVRATNPDPLENSAPPRRILDVLQALRDMRESATFSGLTETMKRISNILDGQQPAAHYETGRFVAPAEHALEEKYRQVKSARQTALEAGDFKAAFAALAELREPLDNYFARDSGVMVMAEDFPLRANRLAFLNAIAGLFNQLFDPALLAGEARK